MATKKSAAKKSSTKAGKAPASSGETVEAAEVSSDRRPMIITFKRKDQRPDAGADKLSIVQEAVATEINFFDSETAQASVMGMPGGGARPERIGFDINEYEAPIVVASLTNAEIRALERNGNVAAVEEDGEVYPLGEFMDFSPYASYAGYGSYQSPMLQREQFVVQGQPSALSETIPAGISQIKAPAAWDSSRGKGINVAVLDTGIDYKHPDLMPNFKGGISFVPGEALMDGHGHGTHCSGTIAAAINGAGVVGVAPAASLYGVKVLSNSGSGSWSWLIAGIDWCIKNNMRVLSMSLGSPAAPAAAVEAMCNAAWGKGLLLVAAAGNSGPGADTVGYPAKYASVIAVSAIDSANVIASFSSRGPKVELTAPGVNVLSTVPGGGFGTMSGTSMACPHVSGTAVVAWGGHRYADNVTIRRLLAWTADNLGVPGRDPLYGFGRVDADQAAGELTPPPAIPGIP
ncbi:MAG TPA: S8 family peptidase [Pyrinomonadaceae bacterium]|jgi:subtilisin